MERRENATYLKIHNESYGIIFRLRRNKKSTKVATYACNRLSDNVTTYRLLTLG